MTHVRHVTAQRTTRQLTASVSIPLAMTAAMLEYLWWTWLPLIICAWWWADRTYRWTWIVTIEAGAIGAQWAYLGTFALAAWPTNKLLVAAIWVGYAALLAAASLVARRTAGLANAPLTDGRPSPLSRRQA